MTTIPKPSPLTKAGSSSGAATNSSVGALADVTGIPAYGAGSTTAHTYLGVPNDYTTSGVGDSGLGVWGIQAPSVLREDLAPLYKTGDQYRQLPSNPTDLAALQHALIDGGYITGSDVAKVAFGSPDPLTVTAFEKLLVTANITGDNWQSAMSKRLVATGSNAPAPKQVPPLTISLTNPEDIKTTLQASAKTLYGGNLPDDVVNRFTAQFQAQEQAAQTQAYYQQYDPAVGGYGPGGTTTAAPSLDAANVADFVRNDPATVDQYKATQFGSMVTDVLDSLRSTGYLPTNSAPA